MKNKNKYLLAVGVLIVLVVGLLFSASKANPNSRLYPIKLNIVEKAFGLPKFDVYQKGLYEVSLGDRRLGELQTLKDQNLLNTGAGNSARDNFNQHTIEVQNIIIDLTNKDGANSQKVLQLSDNLYVQIEKAKEIFNIDQLEVLPEGAPIPKATSTKAR